MSSWKALSLWVASAWWVGSIVVRKRVFISTVISLTKEGVGGRVVG